jgi:glycyl-tRNA synthetase beta chain
MPDLLIELRSEEIPARMQRKAAGDLKKLLTDALVEAGLTYENAKEYWTPRRLVLDIRGLSAQSKDVHEEIKGPSITAPEQAIAGFLRKAGLSSIDQAHIHSDPKKGDFYIAHIHKQGQAASAIIAPALTHIIRNFPWPKSMRWGTGSLKWVRPLQSIMCILATEPEEPEVIPFEIDGIISSNITYGHRFHAPEQITVKRFDDYMMQLEKAKVVLNVERRKQIIKVDATNLAFARGLELVEDEALLEEVAGLVEWPVVLMGTFEQEFLNIPNEIIRLTIKTNQKCFVTKRSDGTLSNHFILTSNIEAIDCGHEITHGNEKVVRARLSDAVHFYKTDQADLPDVATLNYRSDLNLNISKPLDQRMARLDHLNVVFHEKLGTQGQRVAAIAAIAQIIAPIIDINIDLSLVRRAALLAKADLQTEAVGEFPELQGLMGRKYAELQGEHPSVCSAIEDHYKPQGPSDSIPTDQVAICVALADKFHTLTGFWTIDEKPTGSKDPYALRRAALGVIRIILETDLELSMSTVIKNSIWKHQGTKYLDKISPQVDAAEASEQTALQPGGYRNELVKSIINPEAVENLHQETLSERITITADLLSFFHDRLKGYLKDQGARIDLIEAVITKDADNLLIIARKVEALSAYINTPDIQNLISATKRVNNILNAAIKVGDEIENVIDTTLFLEPAETSLFEALNHSGYQSGELLQKGDFAGAMSALSQLREPIDIFLDTIFVNHENPQIKANRLALLGGIKKATLRIADFSKITT